MESWRNWRIQSNFAKKSLPSQNPPNQTTQKVECCVNKNIISVNNLWNKIGFLKSTTDWLSEQKPKLAQGVAESIILRKSNSFFFCFFGWVVAMMCCCSLKANKRINLPTFLIFHMIKGFVHFTWNWLHNNVVCSLFRCFRLLTRWFRGW